MYSSYSITLMCWSCTVFVVLDVFVLWFCFVFGIVYMVVEHIHRRRAPGSCSDVSSVLATSGLLAVMLVGTADFMLFYVGFEILLVVMFGYMGVLAKVQRGAYAQY